MVTISKYRDDGDGRGIYWDGTPEEEAAYLASMPSPQSQIIAQLWQAAHDYEYSEISGSAIGLLAIGVMQGLPKCLSVQAWIKSIWAEYYTRKAMLTQNYDYSGCGACPYSVPELMEELGL